MMGEAYLALFTNTRLDWGCDCDCGSDSLTKGHKLSFHEDLTGPDGENPQTVQGADTGHPHHLPQAAAQHPRFGGHRFKGACRVNLGIVGTKRLSLL